MAVIKYFEDIEAWKEARILTRQIYKLSKRGSFSKDFGLRDQICRAAISIMSNIAEGYESQASGTFIRYLKIAKGSAGELRSQLYIALDQSYISSSEFESLCDLCKKISSQLANLKIYLENQKMLNK